MQYLWVSIYFLVLIWSAINPFDRFTWWLEVFLGLIAFMVLIATFRTFPLTRLLYVLILIHII